MPYATQSLALAAALVAFTLAAPAAAETSDGDAREETDQTRVGVGVDIGIDSPVPVVTGVGLGGIAYSRPIGGGFRLPIDLRSAWQVEPRLTGGYNRTTRPNFGNGLGSRSNDNGTRTSRHFNVGVSVQTRRHWTISEAASGFVGAEVGGALAHAEQDIRPQPDDPEQQARDDGTAYTALFGPVVGAEYFATPGISFGLEAKLSGSYTSNPSIEGSDRGTVVDISPAGAFVLRAYF